MVTLQRSTENPILIPNPNLSWEHDGAFNGCVIKQDKTFHMVYRALSSEKQHHGVDMRISSVGYSQSKDGIHFGEHQLLFSPTEDWEKYGCEDPRITYFEGKYYIFYTALSVYPFAPHGIKTAVATTTDFKSFQKYPVSTFNAKAMALFPEKVNGKMAALLTINTDLPPAKIAIAYFDREEDMWSPYYWEEWFDDANSHIIHLLRDLRDQIELGSPPIKTKDGWLLIYSYIQNYMSNEKNFGVEAVLLDLEDPQKIIGRTDYSLINPSTDYELFGDMPNIVFPSGAEIQGDTLYVYYGAADTRCAVATCSLTELLNELKPSPHADNVEVKRKKNKLIRFAENPIIEPKLELAWQAMATLNPAAIYANGMVHIVYRAQSTDGTSVFGLATSRDGLHIDENLAEPIYIPRESFELKDHPQGNSGCEDPRITRIGDKFYMAYTAYDGNNPPRIALTSISVDAFLQRDWYWERPRLISLPGTDDKDACIIEGKNNDYLAFHRLGTSIWLEITNDLYFHEGRYLTGKILAQARPEKWDNVKLGIASPPIETKDGWLLLYHGVGNNEHGDGYVYKVGAMLLDYQDPFKIIARTDEPILEPEMDYEKVGLVPNVVFPCGTVVIDGILYTYYGGADRVIGVASMPLNSLLDLLLKN